MNAIIVNKGKEIHNLFFHHDEYMLSICRTSSTSSSTS